MKFYYALTVIIILYFRQAVGLWSNLSSIEKIYNAVSLWILTLEKQVNVDKFILINSNYNTFYYLLWLIIM